MSERVGLGIEIGGVALDSLQDDQLAETMKECRLLLESRGMLVEYGYALTAEPTFTLAQIEAAMNREWDRMPLAKLPKAGAKTATSASIHAPRAVCSKGGSMSEHEQRVVDAAIAFCDQLNAFNSFYHPEVFRRCEGLSNAVSEYWKARLTPLVTDEVTAHNMGEEE